MKTREWSYKNVPHKIIVEQFLNDEGNADLYDYKFMCFNGKVLCSFVCSNRHGSDGLKVTFFDNDWNVLPFERHYPKSEIPICKPKKFSEMICLAEELAKNIPFVRVDFYEVKEKIYFGELTFYPGSGMEEFIPESADFEMGSWLELPKAMRNGIRQA